MTIHSEDPFATPDALRSPVRRLRGRMASTVTLWTAGEGRGRAGLTVSSAVVADGDPGHVLGLVDDESEFWSAAEDTGRFVLTLLGPGDRQLADRFAGLMPAPGGLFRDDWWVQSEHGPVPGADRTSAGCSVGEARPFGWGLLVAATIDEVRLGTAADPLLHHRGRYRELR
ncbi:flavin reductase family protein [Hamadaea sp. NPDC051192]|uniref:flavin reductase family protein n=1 Tax=Hamadaea sp. NPDC051192 TaxID=3154940 RepID=UPI003429BE8C